jgi:hypothetical protein
VRICRLAIAVNSQIYCQMEITTALFIQLLALSGNFSGTFVLVWWWMRSVYSTHAPQLLHVLNDNGTWIPESGRPRGRENVHTNTHFGELTRIRARLAVFDGLELRHEPFATITQNQYSLPHLRSCITRMKFLKFEDSHGTDLSIYDSNLESPVKVTKNVRFIRTISNSLSTFLIILANQP